MKLATCLRTLKTRLEHHQPRRTVRRTGSHKLARTWLHMERLEDRLALSGFGPQDGAYIVEPWVGNYEDVKIQPGDQKIVAAGNMAFATNPDGTGGSRVAVNRFDSLGNADSTYGSGGLANPPLGPNLENAGSLVLQPDGKAVLAGNANIAFRNTDLAVFRLNVDGSPDSSFGSGGWASFNVESSGEIQEGFGVGLQSTGKIVVGGTATPQQQGNIAFVARFKASGAIDSGKGGFGQVVKGKATGTTLSTFGLPYNGFPDLAIQPDDKLVAAGSISDGINTRVVVARYTASGTLDTTFNGTGYSVFAPVGITSVSPWAVELQSNGKIVFAGVSSGIDGRGDMLVGRFNTNGTLDTGFGAGNGFVRFDIDGTATTSGESGRDVVIQPDGKIVVVGHAEAYQLGVTCVSRVLVVRFNPDGTPDQSFADGGFRLGVDPAANGEYCSFLGNAVSLQLDGSIIVAGYADAPRVTPTRYPLLMRFFGATASPLQAGSAALASAALASAATADTGMGTGSSTVVPPQRPAPDAAFVENSLSAEILVVGKPGVPVAATVSPRRDSPAVSSAVERIFADDDLLRGLLAEDPLGTIVG